jgi:peptidoglycan hydrolase-like protein with peptidoglycan-binding domain
LEKKMVRTSKVMWATVLFASMTTGVFGLCMPPLALADDAAEKHPAGLQQGDVKKLQESLRDKGYYSGQVDGRMGPQTRDGIRKYQKAENLKVTGHVDTETAGKLGVGPESVGGSFKGAGQEVGKGGAEFGHEMKEGKPVAAGKEMGKGVGRAGEKVGEGVKKAVTTESDRGDGKRKEVKALKR